MSDEIRNKFADLDTLVADWKVSLLLEGNFPQLELHHQSVLVNLLNEAVTNLIEHIHRTAHDLIHFILQQQLLTAPSEFVFIRVHSWLRNQFRSSNRFVSRATTSSSLVGIT